MTELNQESILSISDHIINVMGLCLKYKNVYETDKKQMMQIVEASNKYFYDNYQRICRIIVQGHDIRPLLSMLEKFGKVQVGQLSFQEANDNIVNELNEKYVDGVLNSEKLVKEREEKINKEKIVELDS
jgi:hypothetical protein